MIDPKTAKPTDLGNAIIGGTSRALAGLLFMPTTVLKVRFEVRQGFYKYFPFGRAASIPIQVSLQPVIIFGQKRALLDFSEVTRLLYLEMLRIPPSTSLRMSD